MKRLLPHPLLTVTLVAVWLLLLNGFSIGALVVGFVIGIVVPLFTAPYWPGRPRVRLGWPLIDYLAIVLWDIVVANFQVAAIILFRRNRDLRSRWLVVPLDVRQPEAITLLAGTVSLTPGTVSSDIAADGRALLVHTLDAADPAAEVARIKQRYERRIARIFT
ncbi:Na+/H+ antiporter subunit E [Qipengyuania thermophila]|uniref:Na+/H+ antiporter subunit E n=1 Tax=Qipengyuania thermophila TaxID=2509361 RepID=UPI0018F89310|nr:Na+/H+ antiporter subunit E [Qipengyuania thermophila]